MARNAGCRQTFADIAVPLDADDLMEATYLEYVYWGMYYNSGAAWCYTDSVGFEKHRICMSGSVECKNIKIT